MIKINKNGVFPFLQWWPLITRQTLKADLIAGLTNAFIVLPQGVAFSLIAGLPPIYGLYTAIITPIVAALFGSSYHLISGPTTALSIAVFATISPLAEAGTLNFISLSILLTLMAGIIQFIMGLARMGKLVNFVSHSVVMGFTAGAAVLIITSQIKYVLGISPPSGHSFLSSWQYFSQHINEINPYALSIGLFSLLVAIGVKKIAPKWPNMLITMMGGIAIAYFFSNNEWSLALVGKLPSIIPDFTIPDISIENIRLLSSGAFAVALLGIIEAVAISRSIATLSHQRIDSNQEFIGQGLSNIIGSFFNCYVGSGSFTRSGVNYASGARTPLSAVFAALSLVIILLFVAPLAAYLPMATMGGIIMLVAYNLVDWKHIKQISKTSRAETAILIITFFTTLFSGMELAILSGIIFSFAFYLMKTSQPKMILLAPRLVNGMRKFMNAKLYHLDQCPQLHIIRIDGSLFFGAVESIRTELYSLSQTKKNILIVGSGINFIDATGAEFLVAESARMKSIGGGLYFSQLKKPVREYLDKGYKEKIGVTHFFTHKEEAVSAIYLHLNKVACSTCDKKVFLECSQS